MLNNEKTMDHLKKIFEKDMPGMRVSAIIDYTNKEAIVICDEQDGKKIVPGLMYAVNKRTGDMRYFSPTQDLKGYAEAARNRCKRYN